MNFKQLKDLIITYSHRTDLEVNSIIDQFVENAAMRIGRDCNMIEMERIATLTVTDFAGLPDGYMSMRSVTKPKSNSLQQLQCVSSQQFEQLGTGTSFYSIKNGQIHINGTADITLNYIKRPSQLVNDSDFNFITLTASNLYLYGTLMEVFIFAQDTDAYNQYERLYLQEVERINEVADKQRYSGSIQLRRVD